MFSCHSLALEYAQWPHCAFIRQKLKLSDLCCLSPIPQVRHFLTPQNTNVNEEVESHFFGLFDGHAGGKCSKYISTTLAAVIAEDPQFHSNLPQALKRAFHTANEQFLTIAEKMKLHDGE